MKDVYLGQTKSTLSNNGNQTKSDLKGLLGGRPQRAQNQNKNVYYGTKQTENSHVQNSQFEGLGSQRVRRDKSCNRAQAPALEQYHDKMPKLQKQGSFKVHSTTPTDGGIFSFFKGIFNAD